MKLSHKCPRILKYNLSIIFFFNLSIYIHIRCVIIKMDVWVYRRNHRTQNSTLLCHSLKGEKNKKITEVNFKEKMYLLIFYALLICRSLSYSSSDEESTFHVPKRQKKIGPELWSNVKIEQVDQIPDDVDGLRVYEVQLNDTSSKQQSRMSTVKDGRPWKKDSGTQWKGLRNVRYSDCLGSHTCINPQCDFQKEYGVVNKTQFNKKNKLCHVCGNPGKHVPCFARRYIVSKRESVLVYHCGKHTCPSKPVIPRPHEEIRRTVCENPSYTPSQIQSNIILSKMRQGSNWDSIEKAAVQTLDRKWISNEKQKMKMKNEPYGHNFEAVAHFKQYADARDPYYVYKLNDRRGNPDKPSYVFKTSRLKAKFALNMDQSSDHILSQEFCFFDGKVKRCKGFVSLTASVYHPVIRKLIPLATMECEVRVRK